MQDPVDKKLFHLITSQMSHGCGLAGWRPFITVIRAESRTGPTGPYNFSQELFGTFHHNPTTICSPADKLYLMYSIGRTFKLLLRASHRTRTTLSRCPARVIFGSGRSLSHWCPMLPTQHLGHSGHTRSRRQKCSWPWRRTISTFLRTISFRLT